MQLMEPYRTPIEINDFDESVAKSLLENSLYAYLEMSIHLNRNKLNIDKIVSERLWAFVDFWFQWDLEKISISYIDIPENSYSYIFEETYFNLLDVLVKRPQMIKSLYLLEYKSYTFKQDYIEEYDYFPKINFSSLPDEIREKTIYTHLGIINESLNNIEILKDSKIQMKSLLINTHDFREFPDKIELSESIMSSIESIFIHQSRYVILSEAEWDIDELFSFINSCSKIWKTYLNWAISGVNIPYMVHNLPGEVQINIRDRRLFVIKGKFYPQEIIKK